MANRRLPALLADLVADRVVLPVQHVLFALRNVAATCAALSRSSWRILRSSRCRRAARACDFLLSLRANCRRLSKQRCAGPGC